MKHHILVINGHPRRDSYCDHLATTWTEAAAGVPDQSVDTLHLRDLDFDLNLHAPASQGLMQVEPDLAMAQDKIRRATHLVWVYPNWWGTMPALLKGFVDRAFLPGFAFKYRKDSPFPEQLLKGKTASLVITMDGPGWYYRHFMGDGGTRAMIRSTLGFSGIKTTKVLYADTLRGKGQGPADHHVERVRRLAARPVGA